MKKFLRRTIWAVLIVTGIFALLVTVERYRGKRSLEAYRRQLIAQGEKLEVEDLMPVRTEGEENGAPNLVGATSRLGKGKVVPYESLTSMKMVAPGKARLATRQREWPNFNKKSATSTNMPSSFSVRDLAEDLEAHRIDLNEIRAALKATNFNFDLNYRGGFKGSFNRHLGQVKSGAQWLAAASQEALYETNLEASLENIEALGALSRTHEREPLVINHLVAQGMQQIGLGATWEALQTPGWSDRQLARLQAAWSPHHTLDALTKSLEMERNMQHLEFEEFRDAGNKLADLLESPWFGLVKDEDSPDVSELPSFIGDASKFFEDKIRPVFVRYVRVPLWQAAWSHQEEERNIRGVQKFVAVARQVAVSNSYAAGSTQITNRIAETRSGYDRLRFILPYDSEPALGLSILKAVKTETFRSMTVTVIALKRHELRHGKPAPALKDLAPEFLPSVPVDSINGQPLHYRLNADGSFLLYSVGEDGQDDGGDPRPAKAGSSFGNIFTGRDWVWPVPATAEEVQAAEPKPKRK